MEKDKRQNAQSSDLPQVSPDQRMWEELRALVRGGTKSVSTNETKNDTDKNKCHTTPS